MNHFELKTEETAPESALGPMNAVKKRFGFVPNLVGVLANAPAALKAYLDLAGILSETSFTPVEQQVLAVAISKEHGCHYCTSAHSVVLKMVGGDPATISAVAEARTLPDAKVDALRTFAIKMVQNRGRLDEAADIAPFLAAGYKKEQMLEVLVALAMKTISNYTNHIAKTPLDPQFGG